MESTPVAPAASVTSALPVAGLRSVAFPDASIVIVYSWV
jgi:hypothetical protein